VLPKLEVLIHQCNITLAVGCLLALLNHLHFTMHSGAVCDTVSLWCLPSGAVCYTGACSMSLICCKCTWSRERTGWL